MNVLHFGAGNIGRGLIFPELSKSKEINNFYFVDINKNLIQELNKNKNYQLNYLDDEKGFEETLSGYSAIAIDELIEQENILKSIDIITTSLGKNNLINLKDIFEKICKITEKDIIVMCCENGYRVSSYFKKILNLNENNLNFVDCLVDRIIPTSKIVNTLSLDAELYKSWICDQTQWPVNINQIETLEYSNNIEKEIYKKMCLLNGLHCSIAWQRFSIDKFMNIDYVGGALKENETLDFAKNLVKELSPIIAKKFDSNETEILNYGLNSLKRFQNKFLNDELFRIGRNPIQKLHRSERILSPILFALENNLKCNWLVISFKNGINFHFNTDEESVFLKAKLFEKGLKSIFIENLELTEIEIKKIIELY